jgi:AraC-like DNA-binding protein
VSTRGIPLTRCQFLMPFADICSEVGGPTETLLQKFRLPVSLEEKFDHYVPILRAIQFAEAAQRSQGIGDIGFLASQRLQFCHLSEKLRSIIRYSPTLLVALQQTCRHGQSEDTNLSMWLETHDGHLRVCTKLLGTAGLQHLEHSQWLQNLFVIHIVRQFVGPGWAPATVGFEARYMPGGEPQAFWSNTRFLSAQAASWVDVPVAYLSLPRLGYEPPPNPPAEQAGPPVDELIGMLQLMLPSYLDERIPSISEIAEMANISVRSFQRKLSSVALTYSDLVDGVRFENAKKLLRDTDAKIIDVALSLGYSEPASFTRAFRRLAGVAPRQYRDTSRSQSPDIILTAVP